MTEILKKYFEELIKTDNAIKEAYQESKLKDCVEYIKSQARKQATNNFCAVEDAIVYKWARDFMLGDIPQEEKKEPPAPKEEIETEEEVLNDEEEIITEEKTVIKTKKSPKQDDETQILFDF